MDVKQQIEGFEGRFLKAYPDPLTHGAPWTIGVGHTGPDVHEGTVWTDDQVQAAFDADVEHARAQCVQHFDPWFSQLNEPRQAVLIGMCFQMGIDGLLEFRRTLADVRDGNWPQAAGGMMASKWATQTRRRASILSHQMSTGEWQGC